MDKKTLLHLCVYALFCLLPGFALAAPQTGWWWNPNESGRGFFVESHDGLTFIGAYLYDDDGHAKWVIAGGPNADPYNFSGDLIYKTNGQSLFGNYVAPGDAISAGRISVHFSDDTHGTVTWPGGVVAIEREIYGSGDAPFQPFSGWWWNPSESGSGYSVEVQGNNVFIVGFMYEETGRPVWYLSAGRMSSPTTYHGDVLQYANGQTISGPYHPPSAPTTVATVDVEFTAMNEATFTFTEGASVVRTKAGRSSSRSLEPELPQTPAFQYPQFYVGSFIIDEVVTGVTFHWFSMQNPTLAQGAYTPGVSMEYVLRGAYTFGVQINGFYGNCSVSGSGEFAMPPTGLALRLTPYAQYTLTFGLPASTVDATISCPQQDPASVPLPFPAFAVTIGPHAIPNIDLTGTRAGVHPGEVSLSVTGSASGATLTENFDFLPTY